MADAPCSRIAHRDHEYITACTYVKDSLTLPISIIPLLLPTVPSTIIMRYLPVFAAAAIQAIAASIPQISPIFSGPCAILPPSNNTETPTYDGMQSGATSLWCHEGGGGPKKWTELYIKGITLIPYCFPTEEHRKANSEKLEAAIKLWMTALGGGPSPGTNHNIIFSEYVDFSQNPRYCIDVNSPAESKWNMAVPYKTVAIWKDDGVGKAAAASTVGMGDTPGKPWDLNMWIDVEASVTTVAHELGHVMGTLDITRDLECYKIDKQKE